MSEPVENLADAFSEVVEDFWARAWVMSMGTRTPKQEVLVKFQGYVESELALHGAFPPTHWKILNNDTDGELYEFLIKFIEYLAEW
jgi:hypothetical protein